MIFVHGGTSPFHDPDRATVAAEANSVDSALVRCAQVPMGADPRVDRHLGAVSGGRVDGDRTSTLKYPFVFEPNDILK
jgi:hypothetical protein